ncbi:MSCRAMM family protein, partial [Clostridium perfringens]|uniref:MSCRAMM family protein n=1 Tax=Clostridium perfringens TaxID=1502 RepID=UPI002ACC0CF4
GGISITKIDLSTSEALPGSTISIYTIDDKLVDSKLTEANGIVEFNNLVYGDYYFLETKAPEGYPLITDKHYFSIKEDRVILKDTLTNKKIHGGINISKKDSVTSELLPGATISIYTKGDILVDTKITGKDGTIEFNDLVYGDYYFVETKAPAG